MELTLSIIGGKWKVLILWHLSKNVLRFNELQKKLLYISPKMLTQQLRELEEYHLIKRYSYNQVPPRVEYSLSKEGETILPVLEGLNSWGVNYASKRGGIILDSKM
jgi:DNA-binding HxlR family transcriptional regulator